MSHWPFGLLALMTTHFRRLATFVTSNLLAIVGRAPAQEPENPGPHAAGYRVQTFANPHPGSATIPCFVTYPATGAGQNTPLDRSGAPYPVLVFGHGWGVPAAAYALLAMHCASWGYVVVVPDTSSGAASPLALDMQALTKIVRSEHTNAASFWFGAIDTARFAVAGHSMGGGAAAVALGSGADLQAAVLLAPWIERAPADLSEAMRTARAPFLVLVGSGDVVTPPATNAALFWQKGTQARPLRDMVTFWPGCTHDNVVGFARTVPPTADDVEAFRLSRRQLVAFLQVYLRDRDDLLDVLVGVATHQEPKVTRLDYVVVDPELYRTGVARLGGSLEYHVLGLANAPAATCLAAAGASLPLPGLGTLGLDPATLTLLSVLTTNADQALHASTPVPNLPALAGQRVWMQALALDAASSPRLTSTRAVTLTR